MTTTNTTHTAASLAQLHGRVLDVIAHEKVMQRHVTIWLHIPLDCGTDGIAGDPIPRYSADLNAAALLEKALSERDLGSRYGDELMWNIGICPCGDAMCIVGGHDAFKAISASAAQRTIAAVLAAQGEGK